MIFPSASSRMFLQQPLGDELEDDKNPIPTIAAIPVSSQCSVACDGDISSCSGWEAAMQPEPALVQDGMALFHQHHIMARDR